MKFDNRLADVDLLQQEIRSLRPLRGRALEQLREYLRLFRTLTAE